MTISELEFIFDLESEVIVLVLKREAGMMMMMNSIFTIAQII